MEAISLSWMAHRPALLLKFPNATILLDCALDMDSITSYLPCSIVNSNPAIWTKNSRSPVKKKSALPPEVVQIGDCFFIDAIPEFEIVSLEDVKMNTIDVILISNWMSLIALPFITEKTDFQGTIYATDPTVQFGRLVIEEFLDMIERVDREPSSEMWKSETVWSKFPNKPITDPRKWRRMYTKSEMENSLSKITNIYFREATIINGILKVTAHSSGYAIGSSNWTIQTDSDKVGYLSSTSSRTSHVKSADLDPFRNLDTLILTSLSRMPVSSPSDMVGKMISTIADTLKKGGNVLIPICPTGVIYDLLELVCHAIDKHSLSRDIPIYFISVVAESTLAYANIYSEWLSVVRSDKAYVPEDPFQHGEYVKSGRIKIYDNLHGAFSRDYRTPCIVFTGHPSLRIGDVVHFLELWGKDPRSSIIMTDPDYPIDQFYDPFKSLSIRAYFFPIDTRLDYTQVCTSILPDYAPKLLIMPEPYAKVTSSQDKKLTISHPNMITYARESKIRLPYNQRRKRVLIESELLASLQRESGENGEMGFSLRDGILTAYDNNLRILKKKK